MKDTLHNIAAGLHNRLLDGDLDEEGRRWLADHRARCLACDASFDRLERLMTALGDLERPDPRPDFADRVLAELRPAPAPLWARWRIRSRWSRMAAAAMLAAAGFVALLSPALAQLGFRWAGGPGALFSGPGWLAGAMVELINALEPFGSLGVTVTALGRALRVLGSSPPVLSALAAGAVLSVAALVQLSHLLAAPQRRRSSHA